MNLMMKMVQTAKTVKTQATTTVSGHLAVSQDDIISTFLTKPPQDLAKACINGNVFQVKRLSTIKTAPNPRGGLGQPASHDTLLNLGNIAIEMFDCIMKYARQCNNVESILNFGDVHRNTPILSCFSLDLRSFNNRMKIFEKLTNEFGDIIDIMHFNKFSTTILNSISKRDNNQESALYQACSEQSVEIVELNCSLLNGIGRCDLFVLFFLFFVFLCFSLFCVCYCCCHCGKK